MNEREFRVLYAEAKNDILRETVFSITGMMSTALDTVYEIMSDQDTNPAVRLQAAQVIINNAGRFADRLTAGEEISRKTANPLIDAFIY